MCGRSDVRPQSILLYGPAGCGKTLLARASFGETRESFVLLDSAAILERPETLQPALKRLETFGMLGLCIEHVEELLVGLRSHPGTHSYLLQQLRFPTCVRLIYATTRRPETLAPGEIDAFTHRFPVLYPDQPGRAEILGIHARKVGLDQDLAVEDLAARTEWWSGDELRILIERLAKREGITFALEQISSQVVIETRRKRVREFLKFTAEHCTHTLMRDEVLERFSSNDPESDLPDRVPSIAIDTAFFIRDYVKEQRMGDHIRTGDIYGSVVGGQGHTVSFDQVWNRIEHTTDLQTLAEQLCSVREEMLKHANSPSDYAAIGSVASAEQEAAAGNGAKALEYLSKAGKWALEVATKIGVPVATSALKDSLGLK